MRNIQRGKSRQRQLENKSFLGLWKTEASEEKHIRDLPIDTCQLRGRHFEMKIQKKLV